MKAKNYISIKTICNNYNISDTFFVNLIEYEVIPESKYITGDEIMIESDYLSEIEKLISFHFDLNVNMEGLDIITQLLKKINNLETEIRELKEKVEGL